MKELLLASTGKRAPNIEPMRIMKTAAILKWRCVSDPPPEPQFTVSLLVAVELGRSVVVEDIVGLIAISLQRQVVT